MCLLCVFLLVLCSRVSADSVDVVLTLDRSLSMRANDPGRVSLDAAELLIALMGRDDRLALMTFGVDADSLLPLSPLSSEKTAARASALLRGIVTDGRMTNFEAALSGAYGQFSKTDQDAAVHRAIVLFSDGQMNLGAEDATAAAREEILQRLIPKLQAAHIHVYSVAFSPDADLEFLRLLGVSTGGFAFGATTADDIPEAFISLFEQAEQPLMAPIRDGEVKIDSEVEALKLLVEHGPGDPPVRLTDPSSKELTSESEQPGMTWQSSSRFDHITVAQPEPGAWKVSGGANDGKAYLESAIGLEIVAPLVAEVYDPFAVSARLNYRGGTLDPKLGEDVSFTAVITQESSHLVKQIRLERSDLPGEASARVQLTQRGTARIEVTAHSREFQRSKAAFVELVGHNSPLTAVVDDGGRPLQAEVRKQAVMILIAANAALALLIGVAIGVYRWRVSRRHRATEED
ncbi:VWA domain-containing protein [Thiorhodococcus mannitoliphagus]|uniref:VWA domain-containing protein n=1 Tax=Thiorhodococcus mannitoliphagus TaxID=329406 RepID=A0A6P1DVX4_9GAMM|nr:vWA domain-containing protein [Thiorhodococcus mannitoliphagus]NEX22298.1 VWA domain-containing protein [Thiorhodococcus mannitoliphagus]